MSATKFHHTIAKGLLKHFCYSENKIWYFSKRRPNEGVCSRSIDNKFRRRHYYSVIDKFGVRDDRLEVNFFQILDSQFSELVVAIIRIFNLGSMPSLDRDTDEFAKLFLYFHLKRSPDFNESVLSQMQPSQLVRDAVAEYQSVFGPQPKELLERLNSESYIQDLVFQARVVQTSKLAGDVFSRILGMDLCFALANERSQFAIGSYPIIRMENAKGAKLGDGDVELWTPISPKVLLGVCGPSKGAFREKKVVELNQGQVRVINEQIFKNSTEIGAASKNLLSSLVRSKSMSLSPHH